MVSRLKEYVQNEQGNVALFVIGILSVMAILFVFVFNLAIIFSVKEESSTTAQQASLAATSVLYDQIDQAIIEYENEIIGIVDSYPETIEEKIDQKKIDIQSDSRFVDYSANERSLEAVDLVLVQELNSGIGRHLLASKLESEIEHEIIKNMKVAAKETILNNGGNLEGATMKIVNGQVHVKASNTVKPTTFNGYFQGITEQLFQSSAGPKIDFLEEIPYFNVGTIKLDE